MPATAPPITAAAMGISPGPAFLNPRASFVIPVFNAQQHLAEAMRSVLNQTVRDFEVIAVDDGSTDASLAMLRRFERADPRVRVISRPNTGIVGALNDGIAAARSPLIARMDADDVCLPDRLERQLAHLEAHPDCVLLGAMTRSIDPHGVPLYEQMPFLTHAEIDAELMRGHGGVIRHPVAILRRDALERVGGYRRKFQWAEDLDLFLRLAEVGRVANLPETLLLYRQHTQSVNRTRFEQQSKLITEVVREAATRRGTNLPAEWQCDALPPAAPAVQTREWGWKALKLKRVDAARRHAWALLRMRPWGFDSWRLWACAMRGY